MRALVLSTLTGSLALGALACGDDLVGSCDPTVPGTICTVAGNGEAGYRARDDGGPALEAQLYLPLDTRMAPDGTMFVIDWNNHRIRKISPDGILAHVAGRGELPGSTDEPDPEGSDLNHPTDLLLTPDGTSLIIAAWHNSRIRTVDVATGSIRETCGDGRRAYFGDDGPALTSSLDLPTSVAYDPDGNLVIMDQANQVIRMVDQDDVIHRLAGQCIVGDESLGGEPTPCPGGSGKLAYGDPTEVCSTACLPGYAVTDDVLTMRMGQAFGQDAPPGGKMVYDDQGRLIFADSDNGLIRRIDFETGAVEVIAGTEPVDGQAQIGYAGDGGAATEALLDYPVDLALGDDGTLYLSDVDNHCVRAVDPAGIIRTVAGRCGELGFAGDGGAPTDALLARPFGIDLDGDRLYVSDSGNHRIRVVNL